MSQLLFVVSSASAAMILQQQLPGVVSVAGLDVITKLKLQSDPVCRANPDAPDRDITDVVCAPCNACPSGQGVCPGDCPEQAHAPEGCGAGWQMWWPCATPGNCLCSRTVDPCPLCEDNATCDGENCARTCDSGFTDTVPSNPTMGDGGCCQKNGESSPFRCLMPESKFDEILIRSGHSNCNAGNTLSYENLLDVLNNAEVLSIFSRNGVELSTFGNTGTEEQKKREIAAFLAQASHETSGAGIGECAPGSLGGCDFGLCFLEERNPPSSYIDRTGNNGALYPPTPGQSYHGRGAMQLSWNYNYGKFSQFYFDDVKILLDNPGRVAADGRLAWASALWFWMVEEWHNMPAPIPEWRKPSCHDVMNQDSHFLFCPPYNRESSFGHCINIINGGIECPATMGAEPESPQNVPSRIGYFQTLANLLDITAVPASHQGSDDSYLNCLDQRSYHTGTACPSS